jgi:phospholipase A1
MNIKSVFSAHFPITTASLLLSALVAVLPCTGQAETSTISNECMLQRMDVENDDVTLGQLKEQCLNETSQPDKDETGAATSRLRADDISVLKPYTLIPHRPNYILVAAHNNKGFNETPFQLTFNDPTIELDDTEAQFQISIKFPLAVDLSDRKIDIFAAYTNRSFWQVYNDEQSAPFRDTNHEPEAWIQFRPDWNILGLTNSANQLGFVHQSNGRGGLLSRSWNRVFANVLLERNNFVLSLKPWYRISEDEADDDNPDIEDFLGYGEIRTAYKWHRNTFGLMFRNGFESDFDFTTVELSWSFPIFNYPHFRGYVQYFNGYGQSLVDYNQEVNSIGIGLSLTDYL